jgi:hypothetical protein
MISTVTVNGVATQVSQTFAKRAVPASSTEPLALTATGAMPSLTGSATYVPGDLVITLNFYPSGGQGEHVLGHGVRAAPDHQDHRQGQLCQVADEDHRHSDVREEVEDGDCGGEGVC